MSEEKTGDENVQTQENGIGEMLAENMRDPEKETAKESETPVSDEGDEEGVEPEGEEIEEGSGEEGDEELSELDKLKKQNEVLRQQLQETSAETAEKEKPIESTPLSDDFLKDYDFDEVRDDPEKFKKFMFDVANYVKKQTEESVYKNLPQTVSSIAGQQIELRQTAQNFYNENPELAEVKPFVAKITNQVASENPQWDMQKVLAEVAKRSYKSLGLEKSAKPQSKSNKSKPGFAESKGGSKRRNKAGSELSELEQEIQDILT